MGWLGERLATIINFRLIEPDFDGDSELRKFLGLKGFRRRAPADTTENIETPEIDEASKNAVKYLKGEIDELP
ncbi:MAG: hypothetical protein UU12_C0012G0004 [Candidatus Woesebacteria bacterium GW2011_GWA2_40_7b]|uniref:Uncharacterized protein n=1 Tax=Candidatus Woesebacteria bacterium GW2011_GWA2_40_7b TaxID=1618563 RepID=A0A0G0T1M7_9BACT|nr:MAG: hypothetical protein UU12_C0012G0004 [Candidatus Woesebacteria bacterium GW2011_GWA2_40_7b]